MIVEQGYRCGNYIGIILGIIGMIGNQALHWNLKHSMKYKICTVSINNQDALIEQSKILMGQSH